MASSSNEGVSTKVRHITIVTDIAQWDTTKERKIASGGTRGTNIEVRRDIIITDATRGVTGMKEGRILRSQWCELSIPTEVSDEPND